MTDEPTGSVPIEYSDLLDAYLFVNSGMLGEHGVVIDRTTGTIRYPFDEDEDEDDDEAEALPDDLETSLPYVRVPHRYELNLGNDLVFSFVRQELPDEWDAVKRIFARRGAYARFKDLLHSRGMLDKWHAFEDRATEEALRAWCEDVGIQLSDPPTSTATG
jgi:hypothetical protein